MEKITALYLKHRESRAFRATYMAFAVVLFGLALTGVYRPNPDCNSGCGLI